MIIVTATSNVHLARAMLLAKSIKEHMPNTLMVIGIMEETIPDTAISCGLFDDIVLFKDLNILKNFKKFIFQYQMTEAIAKGKSQIMKYAYDKYEAEDTFVYMDSDLEVMNPFHDLDRLLQEHTIINTPQLIHSPLLMKNTKYRGFYNTGFTALKRHAASAEYLDWIISEQQQPMQIQTNSEWSYSRFSNGTEIDPYSRIIFRALYYDNNEVSDPFMLSNEFFTNKQDVIPVIQQSVIYPKKKKRFRARNRRKAPRQLKSRRLILKLSIKLKRFRGRVKAFKKRVVIRKSKTTKEVSIKKTYRRAA